MPASPPRRSTRSDSGGRAERRPDRHAAAALERRRRPPGAGSAPQALTAGDIERHLHRGNRDLRLAAVAAMFAERLKSTRAGIEVSGRPSALSGELRDEFPSDAAGAAISMRKIRRASRLSPAADDDDDRLDE
ncbi:MAG: hypothetical protein R2862_11550 [Thermoanaerobaculia bacterium]